MSTSPISSHALQNGLTLKFMDESRKIAADRWIVRVCVTIDIPVDIKWFEESAMDDVHFDRITERLGENVVFRQKKERNFVSDDQKSQVVQEICERTLEMGRGYMGRDSFAAKYILKRYADRQQQSAL